MKHIFILSIFSLSVGANAFTANQFIDCIKDPDKQCYRDMENWTSGYLAGKGYGGSANETIKRFGTIYHYHPEKIKEYGSWPNSAGMLIDDTVEFYSRNKWYTPGAP